MRAALLVCRWDLLEPFGDGRDNRILLPCILGRTTKMTMRTTAATPTATTIKVTMTPAAMPPAELG